AHADHTVVANARAMHNGSVADGHACADNGRIARVGMEDHAFLDVGARADEDRFGIAAQRRVKPDAAFGGKGDIADNDRAWRNKDRWVDLVASKCGVEGE